jgi:hypothetical protein
MIIYIASYPRSGNLWVRSLISNQFKKLTTQIHGKVRSGDTLATWFRSESRLYGATITTDDAAKEMPVDGPQALKGRMALYDFEGGANFSHRTLIPGFVDIFKEEIRKYLAEDKEIYFVKTHFHLPAITFPGERVLQIIRHPGATLWSFYKFFQERQGRNDVTLQSVIMGKHDFGDWSEYYTHFKAIEPQLSGKLLMVRYEELAKSESEVCERMAQFFNLPIVDGVFRPFEFYKQKRPQVARSGTVSGWEQNFSQADWDLLIERHGKMMEAMGYSMPERPVVSEGA